MGCGGARWLWGPDGVTERACLVELPAAAICTTGWWAADGVSDRLVDVTAVDDIVERAAAICTAGWWAADSVSDRLVEVTAVGFCSMGCCGTDCCGADGGANPAGGGANKGGG
jgi:hypothetical protein